MNKLLKPARLNRTPIVLACSLLLLLAACEDKNQYHANSHNHGSNNSSENENDTGNAVDAAQEQGGDDYWAELAQSYEPWTKPPLGTAYPPEELINVGNWALPFDWPLIATGAANMPDGRILAWSSQQVDAFGGQSESTHGTMYDPVNDTFTSTPNSTHDMFCAGISMLADGRVFVAGGGKTVTTTSVFDNNQFSEIEPMALTRWYPTSTTLPSGQVFTSLGTTASGIPELWTDGAGWNLLPNIDLLTIIDSENVVHNDWYPALNVAPDGSLFHPGHMEDLLSIYPEQEDSVHEHGPRAGGEASRLYNTTVMYDTGKMLVAGGGSGNDATNSAMTIDVNGPAPVVTPIAPMKHVRSMQNTVLLPTGEVLVIGGNTSGIQFSDEGTVIEPEIWNPITEQWRVVAQHDRPRNYHSVALLMKDARVLAAGGGLCGACATNHQNGEIFTPGYLYAADGSLAARPQITGGAATAFAGDTISVTGSDDIVKFTMLRLVAITHHHTTDQRIVAIDSFKTAPGQYNLTLESNTNELIPGYYWVFGMDQNGVPTEGHTLQVQVSPNNLPVVQVDTSPNVAYEYYEETWPVWQLPNFDTLTPVKTGTQADFSLNEKERSSNYAFRFRASLTVPTNGNYTFYLSSDDGSKLLINNQLVVNHDGAHHFEQEKSGTITLTAGQHNIEIQYFEISGGDALLASWSGPGFNKTPIDAFHLGSPLPVTELENTNPGPALPGKVSYRYYEGVWNNLPDFTDEIVIREGEVDGFDLSPKLVNDFYGFEFTANITVPTSGDYTFFTTSDDGSRLSINGVTVVNNDGRHAPKQSSGTISLAAGKHRLRVDFFEYKGGDLLDVKWQGPGFGKQNLPASVIESNGSVDDGTTDGATTDGGTTDNGNTDSGNADDGNTDGTADGGETGGNGIAGMVNYKYYEGNWFKLPNFATLTPVKQGQSSGFTLTERNRDDFYAMQFTGKLFIPTTGTYTLYSKSDDGSRILINGQLVVLNDGTHPPIEKQGVITLSAGEHDIVVDFFEYAGGDSLEVSWAGPGIVKQAIPLSALATDSLPGNTDSGTTDSGTADTGTTDSSTTDAGTTDIGSTDNGSTDSGTADGGSTDGGPIVGAGLINYQYFEGQWTSLPNFDALTPVLQGQQTDFSLSAKQVSDNYGFRFAAYIDIPADGVYAFYLASDDGSRLSIDGAVVIDNDGLHANREYNATQFLTAGSHHVLVEYFELGGLDTLGVQWSAAGLAKQPLENATLSVAPFNYSGNGDAGSTDGTGPGTTAGSTDGTTAGTGGTNPPSTPSDLYYEYFEGNWTSLPNFDSLTPLSTGSTPQFTLPPSNGVLFYGYRFTGQIYVDQTGIYTFHTASNDGSQLFIDDILIVDNNGKHGVKEQQGSVNLTAGLHDIRVTYFQSNGTEALDVTWSGPGLAKQTISSAVLYQP